MENVAGNGEGQQLAGKDENDQLAGKDGNDQLAGKDVNDQLAGNPEHAQHLAGNHGDDQLAENNHVQILARKLATLPPQVGVQDRGYFRIVAVSSCRCRTR